MLCGIKDCHSVIRAFIFRSGNQLQRNAVGLDIVRQDGSIIKARNALSADDRLIDIGRSLECNYREVVGFRETVCVILALGTDFYGNAFSAQAFKSGDCVAV